jgi:hypothetical protein
MAVLTLKIQPIEEKRMSPKALHASGSISTKPDREDQLPSKISVRVPREDGCLRSFRLKEGRDQGWKICGGHLTIQVYLPETSATKHA